MRFALLWLRSVWGNGPRLLQAVCERIHGAEATLDHAPP